MLHRAIELRLPECVRLLVRAGASLDMEPSEPVDHLAHGWRPLVYAIHVCAHECVEALLEEGVALNDPFWGCAYGEDLLWLASEPNQHDAAALLRVLHRYGAKIDERSGEYYGDTPLFEAATQCKSVLVATLLELGASPLKPAVNDRNTVEGFNAFRASNPYADSGECHFIEGILKMKTKLR